MAEAMEGATNCSLRMLSLSVSPPLCLSVSLFLSLSSLSLSLSLVCFLIAPGLPAQGFHDPELSGLLASVTNEENLPQAWSGYFLS